MAQDAITLNLQPREVTGKEVKHLRREGQIPAVIHDHGKPSMVVQGDAVQMLKVWQHAGGNHPVQLKAGDKTFTALIKDTDFDPKKHQLRHVVFNAVKANEKVEAEVPVHPRYAEDNEVSPAERNGLLALSQLETVLVEAVPSKLPDALYYDAEKLVEVGDHITVADLAVPEGVAIKTDETHAVATVYEPSALQAANEAAGESGPEEAEDVEASAEEGEPAAGESEQAADTTGSVES